MSVDRNYIDTIADMVRSTLTLNVPISLNDLFNAIHDKLQGQCIEKDENELNVDAQIDTSSVNSDLRFQIQYLQNRSEARKLFSIAHELGHLFLHLLEDDGTLKKSAVCQRDMPTTLEELEANEFAAALLMPEDEFITKCMDYKHENKINVTKVANYFNVTVQAATVRGNVLGLWQ